MKLTDVCIDRPMLAWMLMAATVVFGVVAVSRIGISQYPDVDFPTIAIRVSFEGASPEVIEHDVVEPIEEAVTQVQGVRTISSSAQQGEASITVELDLSRDVDLAMQDVQARIAQAQRLLPRDIDPPVVSKTNPEDQPIMWVGLSGPFSRQLLSDTARYVLKERLQTVPGVGEVMMGGYLERNIRVWVDATKLDERELTVSDVMAALRREHVELPAGQLTGEGREINVRVLGEALDLDTLRQLVVRDSEGAPVYLADVALVEDGFEDTRRVARVDGVPAQGLGIRKQRGANAVAVAEGVHAVMDEVRKALPAGMLLGVNFDSTKYISESVAKIKWEVLLAILLTGLACWLFLGSLSSTTNVVLAIPMSLLGTVAVIYFLGYTLNTFTLLALALSVGIVVDDAIMVLENIVRHAEAGKPRVKAAREGTAEITFAAMAATLAVIAIFVPVVFMGGVVGRFFLQFGVTLSVAVALSYVEAVTLAPARCAQILRVGREERGRLGAAADRAFAALAQTYARYLRSALGRPGWVLGGAVALFALAVLAFMAMPAEFVPSQDQSRLLIRLQTAVGSSIEETDKQFRAAEAVVSARPEIQRVFVAVGGFGGGGVNTGVMFLTLKPLGERGRSQADLAAELRRDLNTLPGLRAFVQDLSQQGFTAQGGYPVTVAVQGPEWNELVELRRQVMQKLRQSGTVVDLNSNYQVGMPELRISPNRAAAADLGVSMEDVATTINALVGGVRAGKYSSGGRRVDVRVKLLAAQRTRPEDIGRLRLRGRSGELVPLSSVVDTHEVPVLQSITRRERERAITIVANVAPGYAQSDAIEHVTALQSDMPAGYRLVLGGASATFEESMASLWFALGLGVLVAIMILAAQFNSLLHAWTVVNIIPLAIAGAIFALWATGQTINMFSAIGLLLLVGIVKKNSIVLVDYANRMRGRGLDARAAMLEAGPVRLRPILMTSATTFTAAVPAAIGLGPGSEIRAPMAIAVMGGLVVSTVFSLFVIPAFYVEIERLLGWLRLRLGLKPAAGEAGSAAPAGTPLPPQP